MFGSSSPPQDANVTNLTVTNHLTVGKLSASRISALEIDCNRFGYKKVDIIPISNQIQINSENCFAAGDLVQISGTFTCTETIDAIDTPIAHIPSSFYPGGQIVSSCFVNLPLTQICLVAIHTDGTIAITPNGTNLEPEDVIMFTIVYLKHHP